jgi:hypothetical protein
MKKPILFALTIIVGLSFAFQQKQAKTTPSVKIENLTDSIDLDAQMKVYETQMRELEKQMKPFELQMKEQEKLMKPLEKLMKDKERELKSGGDSRKIGNEMSKIGDDMGKIGNQMGEIGNQMSSIGMEMSKIGDKMSVIGQEMQKRHKKVFSWFFNELTKDGLMSKGEKCSIFMENKVLLVNGKNLETTQFEKYKRGIEAKLGKPLSSDFSFFFKGTVEKLTDESFETDGNMNIHF